MHMGIMALCGWRLAGWEVGGSMALQRAREVGGASGIALWSWRKLCGAAGGCVGA